MPRFHSCLSTVVLFLILSGCTRDSIRERLDELADQLHSTKYADTTVWHSVTDLRRLVIEHNCMPCDSVYNSLVADITEHNLRDVPPPTMYLNSIRKGWMQIDSSGALLHKAHELRYWGSYNGARSLYVRASANDQESADALANKAMEYLRIGLIRPALLFTMQADSIWAVRTNHGGRVWTQRLLYSIYSALGLRDSAIKSLDRFRFFRASTYRATNWRPDDSVTDFNLVRTILLNRAEYHKDDIRRAFGSEGPNVTQSYARYYRGQSSADLAALWDTRNLISQTMPKPVIRRVNFDNLKSWTDSISTINGRLEINTRFGRFQLVGDRWELQNRLRPEITSLNPAHLHVLDTVFFSDVPIRRVFPLSNDTLLVLTDHHFIRVVGDSLSYYRLPVRLSGDRAIQSISLTIAGYLLVSNKQGVYLLNSQNYNIIKQIEFENCGKRPMFLPESKPFILMITDSLFAVKQAEASNLWGVSVKKQPLSIQFVSVKYSNSKAPTFDSPWKSLFGRFDGSLYLPALSIPDIPRESDTLHAYDIGHFPIASTERAQIARNFYRSNLHRIPAPHGIIALRVFDYVDIIDTANQRCCPNFAVPFPSYADGSENVGVYKDSIGLYYGFFNDGFAIIRFQLASCNLPLTPRVMIQCESDSSSACELSEEYILEPDKAYRVYSTSNLLTSSFTLNGFTSGSGAEQNSPIGQPFLWHVRFIPSSRDSTINIVVLSSGRTYRLAVHTPFFKRPWVMNSTYPLVIVLVIGSALFGILRYRQRRNKVIHEAKSQQLELIREDMHDMIGSRLVRIASLARQTKPEDADTALARIHDMTLVTVRSLRNLLSLMSETTMTDAEFFGALREYVVESCTDAALTPTVVVNTIDDQRTTLDGGDRHELMMIVSEMLANTLRHAQARSVSFTICSDAQGITLNWQDDGVGIAPSSQRGNGLNNIQRRAARIHASVKLVSHPGGGTQYTIAIPISAS